MCEKKFDDIDVNLILKSLVYFDDVELEPIVFKHGNQVKFDEVKKFLIKLIKSIKTNTE